MPLIVVTADPSKLLKDIKAAIRAGTVRTWACNSKGQFTHTSPQWKEQAWLVPTVAIGSLEFVVEIPKGEVKQGVAGVYQGRFSTMLMNHFGYNAVESTTAQPTASPASKPSTKSTATTARQKAPSSVQSGTRKSGQK